MEYIIGLFIIIVIFVLVGVVARKKIYNRVDGLEWRKVQLMERQVAEELGKVKHLNLTGETEELFEAWRSEWDEINDEVFTLLEEYLLDAEELAERYKFGKASRVLNHVEQRLNKVEQTIEEIFEEVDRLLHSEQDSREEAERIPPQISEVRKKVLQNGYQLGKAEVVFEVELDEIQQEMSRYEELTSSGNYTEANLLIHDVKSRLEELNRKVDHFPELYRLCKHTIPDELDQLQNGLREMREEGYRIQHLGADKEIQVHHETLLDLVEQLNKGNDESVNEQLQQIKSRMVEIYDQLEKEAYDKNYVLQKAGAIDEKLDEAHKNFTKTKENVMAVKENYHLKDEKYDLQYHLEKSLDQLEKKAARISTLIEADEEQPFSTIRLELEEWLNEFAEWDEQRAEFDDYLYNLRRDELSARDDIDELKQRISHVRQQLQKSNLPGIPNYLLDLVEQALELIEEANSHLNAHPLDIDVLSGSLKKAEKCVDHAIEQTNLIIDQAQLAERVIQYANRYRSQYPVLAAKISESEQLFLNFEYEVALEQAGEALEEIESGALKKIEETQSFAVHR
ncbi:septation ring formation regulator EzrA [Alkalibacillus aidingensis]|uniref:septation ring formation regulator EzrA n=1 Tax=Alkalibacillus aidingensis TaxID=2747607 RepID=UPI0016601773|nr:septation ring formation regulator EzrA [Alkalibacillus aidingensis]